MRKALKRMLVALAIIVGLVALVAAPFLLLTPARAVATAELDSVEKLDAYLAGLVANETPPALDVTVVKDGATVYHKAFGVADGPARIPATTDAVYHFWSVTKLFTATAVMQLVEDGKIGLDDPVTKYLPDFATVLPAGAPAAITVRELLNHSSGMKNLGPGRSARLDPPPRRTAGRRNRAGARAAGSLSHARLARQERKAPTAMPAISFSAP